MILSSLNTYTTSKSSARQEGSCNTYTPPGFVRLGCAARVLGIYLVFMSI